MVLKVNFFSKSLIKNSLRSGILVKAIGLTLIILAILIIGGIEAKGATWIDDRYEMVDGVVSFERWDGIYRPVAEMNITTGEWSYLMTEDNDNVYLKKGSDFLTISKDHTTFKFDQFTISPTITYTQTELSDKSKRVTDDWRYIKIPFKSLKGVKKTTPKTLHLEKFIFYAGNTHITVRDSIGTILNTIDYDFQIKNNQIRLYYNPTATSELTGDISLEMHSWQSDTSIISGLTPVADQSGVESMYLGDVLHLLISHDDKVPEGHHWTGSAWTVNTTITTGLPPRNVYLHNTFYMDSIWYYLCWQSIDNLVHGYNWTGSAWQSDSAILPGLDHGETYCVATTFEMDSEWYTIIGKGDIFFGHRWNGTGWENNATIISGLTHTGNYANPETFVYQDVRYLLVGNGTGYFQGWNWTGSTWQRDYQIESGLGDSGARVEITFITLPSDVVYAITVTTDIGALHGFNLTGSGAAVDTYIPPDPVNLANITGNYWVNYTWSAGSGNVTDSYNILMNSTWHNSTVESYFNQSLSNCAWGNITVYAYNSTGTGELSTGYVGDQVQMSCAAPTQVTGLQNDTYQTTIINISWTPNTEDDLWGYQVFRNDSHIGYTQNAYYNDSGLSDRTEYNYIVRANNTLDMWGTNSSTLSTTTDDTTPPVQVTGLQNDTYQTTIINISWTSNTEDDLWGYQVFRNDSHIGYTQNAYYNDSGLSPETLYNYIVRANDTIYTNWGTNSSTLGVTTDAITAVTNSPTGLDKTYGDDWVKWAWSENTDGNHDVDTYNVSINETWYNTSGNMYYNHTDLSAGDSSHIIIYGFNGTAGLSLNSVSGSYTFPTGEVTPISFMLYISTVIMGMIFLTITFITNIEIPIKIATSTLSGIIFLLSGITMFTKDIQIYDGINIYIINSGWVGSLLTILGMIMVLYTVVLIYQTFASEKQLDYGYRGHG